jgi:phenylacetate-CoA ligase
VAVYADMEYGREDGSVLARESFALFVQGLRDFTGRLLLVGRVHPRAGSGFAHPLRPDVELLALPHYAALAWSPRVLASLASSLVRFWRALDRIDAVWLLGPHPLAIAFAVMARARRRRVVLGVRQEMRRYVRHRHPRRRGRHVLADVLERSWRALSRLFPTVVVGSALARQYGNAAAVVPIVVTLVERDDVVSAEQAATRPYRGDLRLLSVGRLDAEKNPLILADVLSLLRGGDRRWRLVVCGDGAEREALAARLRRLGLDQCVELRGLVSSPELRSVYASSHVFLHTAWTEGVPQVLFEAFAAGVPVVATDVGGVAAAAGDAALLVPPGDAAAAATAVSSVVRDARLRAALIAAGVKRARECTATAQRQVVATTLMGVR